MECFLVIYMALGLVLRQPSKNIQHTAQHLFIRDQYNALSFFMDIYHRKNQK